MLKAVALFASLSLSVSFDARFGWLWALGVWLQGGDPGFSRLDTARTLGAYLLFLHLPLALVLASWAWRSRPWWPMLVAILVPPAFMGAVLLAFVP